MQFVTTSGERSAEELAARVFGVKPEDPITRRAAAALIRANPRLTRIDELGPTLVAVPETPFATPAVPTSPLPDAAAELVLAVTRDLLSEFGTIAAETVKGRRESARERKTKLDDSATKRRARADKAVANRRREAKAEAGADVTRARLSVKAYESAFASLGGDLDALHAILRTAASTPSATPPVPGPMTKGDKAASVHTVPHGDRWANRRAGSTRVSRTFAKKTEAVTAGRETARRNRTEHIIHKKDGSIASRNSYGGDARSTKG